MAGFATAEARKFFGAPPKFSAAIERDYLTPWTAGTAEGRFKERFEKLLTRLRLLIQRARVIDMTQESGVIRPS